MDLLALAVIGYFAFGKYKEHKLQQAGGAVDGLKATGESILGGFRDMLGMFTTGDGADEDEADPEEGP